MTTGPRKRSSPRNEGKACDSVVRCLEHRMGETRAAIRRPETEGIGPRVDFHLMLGTREYAIEHTQIEAVPGFIRTGEGYAQLIKPVIAELSGTLPGPADYWLYFPLDTHLGVKKAELDRIRQGLIAWVRVKARRLYERNLNRLEREHKSPRYIDSIEANPPASIIRYASGCAQRSLGRNGGLLDTHAMLRATRSWRLVVRSGCGRHFAANARSSSAARKMEPEPSWCWRATISPSRITLPSANASLVYWCSARIATGRCGKGRTRG